MEVSTLDLLQKRLPLCLQRCLESRISEFIFGAGAPGDLVVGLVTKE